MMAADRNILRRNRVSLVRELSVDIICQIMVGGNILSDHMVEEISSNKTTHKQNVAFLTKLPTRGPLAFDTFYQALHGTGQAHLAELLVSPSTPSTKITKPMPHSAITTLITPPSIFLFEQSTPSKTQIFDPHFDISTTNLSPKSFNISPANKLYSHILIEKSPNVTSSTYKTTNKSEPSRLTPVEHVDVRVFEQKKSVFKFDAHIETLHSGSSIEDLQTTAGITKHNHISTADTNHICHHLPNNHISNASHGDMQSMPLVTDAPTWENVAVRPSSRKFLQERMHDCYPMFNSCKGIALIISVTEFEAACLDDRLGGDRDSARLELMFKQLSYEVLNLKNGTACEIWNTLKNFSAWPKLGQCSSCFIVLMSHGKDGVIFGKDGQPVCLKDVFDLFSNENCSYLQNKPKVFLIPACRGYEPDHGTDQIDGPTPEKRPYYLKEEGHGKNVKRRLLDENKNEMKVKLPSQSDCLIAYATVPGYTAMRNPEQGSWFIQAFIQIVALHAKDKSLLEIMTMTNNQMKSREGWSPETEFHRCKVMSEFTSSLCKSFYFFPGFYLKQTS